MKIDKSVDDLHKRLDEKKPKESVEDNVDIAMEARFVKLREARAKKIDSFGSKTYEYVRDNITQEEIDYYKKKALQVSPEERYQEEKKHWYFHGSSWYMRGVNAYDGHGCNQFIGCIPECKFYSEYGRIEDEEVLKRYVGMKG